MTASRRILALTLTIGLLAAPLAIGAQSAAKMPRIAVVFGVLPVTAMLGAEPSDRDLRAFLQGLRTLGYVEGQNIVIERRSAEGRFERFPEIFAELVQTKVDVIVTSGNLVTRAAKEATSTIPIVMATSAPDAVTAGFVASFARPGGNITGNSTVDPQRLGKVLEVLKEAVPRVSRVAVLLDGKNPRPDAYTAIRTAADALRLTLLPVTVDRLEQLAPAFATFTRDASVFLGPLLAPTGPRR